MTEVSDRLRALTGNSAIDGYQSENPERVDAIAHAVFDAMRARDIRYAEPPASWGTDGQKVRTPAEVFEGRLGTCLDTTMTMAAALEQAGINSTIWVVERSRFPRLLAHDAALSMISVDRRRRRRQPGRHGQHRPDRNDDGHATRPRRDVRRRDERSTRQVSVERLYPRSSASQTFAKRASAKIFPLPSRATDADGNVVVTQYEPGAGPVIAPYVAAPAQAQALTDG